MTGLILLGFGIFGFVYCGDQAKLKGTPPDAGTLSIQESWQYEGTRWEMARWAAAVGAGLGTVLLLMPSRSS